MYSFGGLCVAVEGYVWLWRGMYSCGGSCMVVYGCVRLCISRYKSPYIGVSQTTI